MKQFALAASAALLLATATQAVAQDVRTARVSYQDLNLTSEAGVDQLKQRISRAVNTVCKADDISLEQKLRERACYRDSAASAGQDVARVMNRANQAQASLAPTNQTAR